MSYADQQYHTLLQELVDLAESTPATNNRTDTDAFTLFGRQMRFDLTQGFPLLTTKKVHFKSVLIELLWFLKGDTNIRYLLKNDCHIWTEWRYKEYLEHHNKVMAPSTPLSMKEFEEMIINGGNFSKRWGDIGKGYGHQWRNFGEGESEEFEYYTSYGHPRTYRSSIEGFDQIEWVINEIKTNPKSRRLIVTGWNPHEVDKVDLPPCHTLFQFHVELMTLNERKRWVDKNYVGNGMQAIVDLHRTKTDKERSTFTEVDFEAVCDFANAPKSKLSCQLYQRSADVFLGVPFNIASYALLTQMIAQVCGLGLGEFIWTGGNVHLYENHLTQAKDQLVRNPTWHECPKLTIDTEGKTIFEITEEDVHLEDYNHFPPIKAPVAV